MRQSDTAGAADWESWRENFLIILPAFGVIAPDSKFYFVGRLTILNMYVYVCIILCMIYLGSKHGFISQPVTVANEALYRDCHY